MLKTLLIIPPFTQVNTPYPSTTQLAGFLKAKGYPAENFDMSLSVFLKIFSEEGLKKIVVGEVKECVPHPNSDHLSICQVDIGEEELSQIVCGAPNVKAGVI